MSELREVYKEEAAFDEIEAVPEIPEEAVKEEISQEAEISNAKKAAYEKRMNRRRSRIRGRKRRRKIILVILMIAAFAALATMCGRDIVRLRSENRALLKQQKELEEQRDKLKNEVEKSGQREYVQEQARKQLHLLNPGELLFTFDAEDETSDDVQDEAEEEPEADTDE